MNTGRITLHTIPNLNYHVGWDYLSAPEDTLTTAKALGIVAKQARLRQNSVMIATLGRKGRVRMRQSAP
jgi:hypothetical protein